MGKEDDGTQHFVASQSAGDYEAALPSIHGVTILCFDCQPEDGQCRRSMMGKFESPVARRACETHREERHVLTRFDAPKWADVLRGSEPLARTGVRPDLELIQSRTFY